MDIVFMASRVHWLRLAFFSKLLHNHQFSLSDKHLLHKIKQKDNEWQLVGTEEVWERKWLLARLILRPLRDTWITGVSDPERGPTPRVSEAAKTNGYLTSRWPVDGANVVLSQHNSFDLSGRQCATLN